MEDFKEDFEQVVRLNEPENFVSFNHPPYCVL